MSFNTYYKARKALQRTGVAMAPFVVAWHFCPLSDENLCATPPDHVEQHAHHPVPSITLEVVSSAASSSNDLSMRIGDENLRVSDTGMFRVL
jgi:hypothetical protein